MELFISYLGTGSPAIDGKQIAKSRVWRLPIDELKSTPTHNQIVLKSESSQEAQSPNISNSVPTSAMDAETIKALVLMKFLTNQARNHNKGTSF